MADFFTDLLGQAISNRITNRTQDFMNTLENPGQTLENRFNTAMGQNVTTTTEYRPNLGPTIAPLAGPAQSYDMGEMAGVDQAVARQAQMPQLY